ncbi:hypothetical protein D9758_013966 [Tetrapyrgos nigripes]|uniref:HAT C-terminal dimerisation domain-containing protein n=1 Tax=Tetrapyrgos nigripes TaxID=182062 RepID=A0A8H5LJW9_9AGAR|nr:hypothetical protein D9758_013966 [Tetrapyrgos nigripes]
MPPSAQALSPSTPNAETQPIQKRKRNPSERASEGEKQKWPRNSNFGKRKNTTTTTNKLKTKNTSKPTVMSEEEDEASQAESGIEEIVEVDKNGMKKSRRSLTSAPKPTKKPATPAADADDEDIPNLEEVEDSDDEDGDKDDCDSGGEERAERLQEEADEEELGQRNGVNPSTLFFDPEPTIEYRKDNRKCVVFRCSNSKCKRREVVRYLDTRDSSSTGNMRTHVKSCWGEEILLEADKAKDVDEGRKVTGGYKRNGSITAAFEKRKGSAANVTYSYRQHTKAETRVEIVRWVSESLRPLTIVKDRGFNCLMKTGRPHYYLPHPTTVSRDVKAVFAKTRRRIADMLQNTESDINCCIDTWSSPNHKAYAAITAHFEHEGHMLSLLMDFIEIAKSHSGENMAEAFAGMLQEFGIAHKLLSITCDNASNNDTMIESLEERLTGWAGRASRTRCFAHIVNLVAKSLLKLFDTAPKKAKEAAEEAQNVWAGLGDELETEEDDETIAKLAEGMDLEDVVTQLCQADNTEDDDIDGLVDELEEMSAEERKELEQCIKPVKIVLVKLRRISFKIINSTTKLLPAWKETVVDKGLDQKMLPRDVTTRWNSTYDMTSTSCDYRPAIDSMTADRANELRAFELSGEEWNIVGQLVKVLRILKDATEFFSRNDVPNLAAVIPAMDKIDSTFSNFILDNKLHPAIRSAVSIAKKTLNRYYDKTDHSEVYRIAMSTSPFVICVICSLCIVLHPRHKLSYFEENGWEKEWIDAARDICREEYNRKYKGWYESEVVEVEAAAKLQPKLKNQFDELDAYLPPKKSRLRDELNRYLSTDPEAVKDPIQWWTSKSSEFPCLSRMAMNYLSIPATSVAVERVFSRGRILISHIRNGLSAQTMRSLLCLGSWSILGLVHDDDLRVVATLPEVDPKLGDEYGDYEMESGWDTI